MNAAYIIMESKVKRKRKQAVNSLVLSIVRDTIKAIVILVAIVAGLFMLYELGYYIGAGVSDIILKAIKIVFGL